MWLLPALLCALAAQQVPALDLSSRRQLEMVECEGSPRLSVHWPPQRCGAELGPCRRVLDAAVGAPTQPRCAPIHGYPNITVCCVGEGTQTLEEALVVARQLNLTNNGQVVFPGRRLVDWLIATASNALFPNTASPKRTTTVSQPITATTTRQSHPSDDDHKAAIDHSSHSTAPRGPIRQALESSALSASR